MYVCPAPAAMVTVLISVISERSKDFRMEALDGALYSGDILPSVLQC